MRVIREYINEHKICLAGKDVVIRVPRGETSKVVGQKRKNKLRLIEYGAKSVRVIEDERLDKYRVVVEVSE